MSIACQQQRAHPAHSSDDATSLRLLLERLAATEAVAAQESDVSAQVLTDKFESKLEVPVVDLKDLAGGDAGVRLRIGKEITEACQTWGMFHIVNHGIPHKIFQEVNKQARAFFALPLEVKERVNLDAGLNYQQQGFLRRLQPDPLYNSWRENLSDASRWSQTKSRVNNAWPNGNAAFVESLQEYLGAVDELGLNLIEILAEGLGLESNFFSKQLRSGFDEKRIHWRVNFYPPCPAPERTVGLTAHTDPNLLSLVSQDEICGLQVKKGDQWVDVPSRALVVNVGDSLEAWTNGRLKSVVHRVLVNNTRQRISWVYLMSSPEQVVVQAPPQFIDDEHPQLFKPFTYENLMKNLYQKVSAARMSQDPQKLIPKKIFYDYALLRP